MKFALLLLFRSTREVLVQTRQSKTEKITELKSQSEFVTSIWQVTIRKNLKESPNEDIENSSRSQVLAQLSSTAHFSPLEKC